MRMSATEPALSHGRLRSVPRPDLRAGFPHPRPRDSPAEAGRGPAALRGGAGSAAGRTVSPASSTEAAEQNDLIDPA